MEYDLVVEGRVVLRDSTRLAQVGISEGKIASVKTQGLKGGRWVRAGESLVFPGFIDSHVHLREPGWEHKEDFRTGTRAAAHGGVTTVLDMPNTPRPATSADALRRKARLAVAKGCVDIRLFAGLTDSNLEEAERMAKVAIGFKGYLGRTTGGLFLSRAGLEEALPIVAATTRPVSFHCEDQSIIDARTRALSGSGAPDVYCDMRPPEAEAESVGLVVAAAKMAPKARVNICHVSTSKALGLIEASARRGRGVRCEAALHHLFFSRKAMLTNPLLRVNPPLRQEEDRDAMVRGLAEGRVASLVTDHAPHTREEKLSEGLAGVPGLDDFGHMVAWLITSCGVDLVTVGRVASSNPAEFYGLEDRGEIAVGRRADLTVIDISASERVRSDSLQTKCGWSPYEGVEFPGRTTWTIREGLPVMEDGALAV